MQTLLCLCLLATLKVDLIHGGKGQKGEGKAPNNGPDRLEDAILRVQNAMIDILNCVREDGGASYVQGSGPTPKKRARTDGRGDCGAARAFSSQIVTSSESPHNCSVSVHRERPRAPNELVRTGNVVIGVAVAPADDPATRDNTQMMIMGNHVGVETVRVPVQVNFESQPAQDAQGNDESQPAQDAQGSQPAQDAQGSQPDDASQGPLLPEDYDDLD